MPQERHGLGLPVLCYQAFPSGSHLQLQCLVTGQHIFGSYLVTFRGVHVIHSFRMYPYTVLYLVSHASFNQICS